MPVLDARPIDPLIRQSAVFGVLIGLTPGSTASVLSDEPLDLVRTLLQGQFADQYEVEASQGDDREWQTTFTRIA